MLGDAQTKSVLQQQHSRLLMLPPDCIRSQSFNRSCNREQERTLCHSSSFHRILQASADVQCGHMQESWRSLSAEIDVAVTFHIPNFLSLQCDSATSLELSVCSRVQAAASTLPAMFKNTPKYAFLTLLYSEWLKPIFIWRHQIQNGHIKRLIDDDTGLRVIEIVGTDLNKNVITCPADPKHTLGVKHRFLIMIVKDLGHYFSFEVQILDDTNQARYFRATNYEANSRVRPLIASMPLKLHPGWNRIEFNLAEFTKLAYNTKYVETLRVQVHANCRIRRIYFTAEIYPDEEIPEEFRLVRPKYSVAAIKNWRKLSKDTRMFSGEASTMV